MAWKQTRHHAPNTAWPPKGIELVLHFAGPSKLWSHQVASDQGRSLLTQDAFENPTSDWKILTAENAKNGDSQTPQFQNAGRGLLLSGPVGRAVLLERPVPDDAGCVEVVIDPIDDQDTSWGPGLALVCPDGAIEVNLRPGDRGEHGHFELRNRGAESLAKISLFAAQDHGIERTRRYALRVRWQDDQMIWDVAQLKRTSNSPTDAPARDATASDLVDPRLPYGSANPIDLEIRRTICRPSRRTQPHRSALNAVSTIFESIANGTKDWSKTTLKAVCVSMCTMNSTMDCLLTANGSPSRIQP
jgi:hypothetical protein